MNILQTKPNIHKITSHKNISKLKGNKLGTVTDPVFDQDPIFEQFNKKLLYNSFGYKDQ